MKRRLWKLSSQYKVPRSRMRAKRWSSSYLDWPGLLHLWIRWSPTVDPFVNRGGRLATAPMV